MATQTSTDQEMKLCKSGYNLFCSELWQMDEIKGMSQAQKCKEGARRWRNLTPEQQIPFKSRATKCVPTMKDRRRTWKKSCKAIMKHQKRLTSLCSAEVFTVVVQKGTHQAKYFASPMGETFLEVKNKLAVVEKFQAYVTCHEDDEDLVERKKKISVKIIQDIFNSKYALVSGKPHARMSYKLATLSGLPDGIPFKKPILYGSKQRRAIWEKREEIKCILTNTDTLDT